ncbi:MAG: DUF262 domain-containing protein [Alphaproteobacteria bacterium]|nr:DUF262 domain-containing protein [Alphaproteobacteria bacterium]
MSTFDSTKLPLTEILADIVKGKIQLPDFQRGWIWDDEHVRSLLVSIARSFPVGAVMLLETGGEARFQMRPIENVQFGGTPPQAEMLILDGQQRLTTLTQVLALDGTVKTRNDKGKAIERYYYFDIRKALEGHEYLEDALIAVEPDRKLKENFGRDVMLDLSKRELECRQLYFPCKEIFNSNDWEKCLYQVAKEHFDIWMEFREKVIEPFKRYQLPIIRLKKETTKEAVCLVFEKVNTGGVPLSVFELVTASYAADGYNLRDDWFGSTLREVSSRYERMAKEPMLKVVGTTDFLQSITMLQTLERRMADLKEGKAPKQSAAVSAKRVAILSLPLEGYRKWADKVEAGFMLAAKFLRKECFTASRDLPYRTQLPPLAAVMTQIGERWLEPRIYEKLAQWFWCGVLGELYGGAVESRMANDVEDLLAWVEDGAEEPRTIAEASFQPDRLDRLSSRLSAAYKGLNVLVLRDGAEDFFWKANIRDLDAEDVALDIHHIFPQDWCEKQKIPRKRYNAIVNKTPISYKANRKIGGIAPSLYLQKIQSEKQVRLDDAAMDKILESHLIPAEALRHDNFEEFYRGRKQLLVHLIEKAMGKSALPLQGGNDLGDDDADDQEEAVEEQESAYEDEGDEAETRTPNRDLTRFELDIGGKVYTNLPKRELVYLVVKEAIERGFKPQDLIARTWAWVFVDGVHNEAGFLQKAESERHEGSSVSGIKRFYTEDEHLFHVGGRTYALTKMWGRSSLPTVNDLISRCGLSHVKYAAMEDEAFSGQVVVNAS